MFGKSDINLEEWEFEFQQRNYQPFLMSDLYYRSLYNNHQKEINLPTDKLDYLFTSSSRGYVKSVQKAKIIREIKKASKNNYSNYVLKRTIERTKELDNFANNIKINSKMSNKEIISLWKEFDRIFLIVIPWFYIPWYLTEENIVSDQVKAGLLKHKEDIEKITDLNNALTTVIFPVKKAMFQKEQKDLFGLVEIAKNDNNYRNNKSFVKKAEKYLKEYSWITTYFILPINLLNMSDLIKKIEDALNNNFTETYKEQKIKRKIDRELANKIIKTLKNDKDLICDIELAQELGWLLTFGIELGLMATSKLIPLFKIIAKRINISYKEWVYLTSDEIIKLLEGKSTITSRELKERQLGYVFLSENGEAKTLSGKKGKELADWIDNNIGVTKKVNINKIRGQSASPGIVKGIIKIIPFIKDLHLIKNGEILVCSMTSPHYLPAMKKSSAIITDEGGLLSHAAIISRELGKPCVVGTKIATKVLKDGDLVEVDADKGIVKILKKK